MSLTDNLSFRRIAGQPIVVSFGGGIDSSAMLLGLYHAGVTPDLILFADVGDEWPETYQWIATFSRYLQSLDFPAVTTVKYVPRKFKHGPYSTLYGNCWQNRTLPSLAFGRKACSNKWKIAPMDKYVAAYTSFDEWRSKGGKIARLIGYDCGPKDCMRGGSITDTSLYEYRYPLREWGWTREECKQVIREQGLAVPRKSACFYCPSTQKDELIELVQLHPDLARKAVQMEDRARPNLQKIEGLWRNGCKGKRDPDKKKPGSWRQFLEDEGYGEIIGPVDETEGPAEGTTDD